ncbi:C80 family cysteine peptidase [Arsenophonus nasoniae]|uniref:C80 family cysteine peptidase n=1 Tax=Arsenophonus nasoniae TaxID=638 RepID=D2U1V4_9GAMM|nr:C80 family cysteine peptidase [Arsenophonus nasoniae]WGM04840.1 C80 family cysteine peptidase [Arsenophonus nasoniae]WGM09941.1 C80 family cysteine peptidase [Arsenophonus nasoniae]WGM14659.1 C80 family cysteine peptidase [Arsenophonus nasoniae]CBA74838.1 virulence determinant [Arsenophonus nasoniae]
MRVNEIKRMDIDFNQKGIIFKFAEKWLDYNSNKFFIRSSDERKKMIYGGLCWGLTRYYMTHIAQNGQQNSAVFFIKFKRLIGLANREIPINASIIERYQIEAERRYANTILDKVLFDILNEHTYANSINLLQSYRIPQVKSYLRTKEDPTAVNAHKIIKRIYRNEFIKNHDLVKERWFVDIFLIAEKNFTAFDKKSIMEIQSAIEAAKIKIYKIYVDDEINYLKNRGVLYLKKSVSDINNNYYIDIDNLFSHMTNKHQNAFYEIYTGNHVVVLTVTVNPSNNEKNITFFDSNKGLYLFNDLAEAKNFIIEFSKYTSEKYQWNLEKIDNPEIHIGFFAKASDFSDKLIDLTPPKYQISSMVINKMITHGDIIQTNEDVEIKFLQLNQHNNIVTFSIEEKSNIDHGNKKIIMSTDHIDIRTIIYLVNKEQDNLFALSHQNLFTRFDKGNIQVYQLPDNFDLSANIKDIYDKLPTPAYKVVPDSTTQSYEMVSRAPRIHSNNNLNIDFDKWRLPIIQSELITNNSHQNNLSLAYERTIIIQIQSNTILDQIVSGLIAKHPEKTILLQFDIATKKRRLAYGRHEDLLSAGQTRWIVVGHGDYQGNGKVSQFAQHSPKAVANGLQWLKNDLAIKQTPNKIVLMGCELAEGTAKEDFAFNMTQLLNKNAFDADIIAYTNDLFIDSHGKRIGYINNESDESQPARIYKKTYRYHHATDSITINGKPVILSLLNDLQADKVSFERFITDNQQLLIPLFSAPSGELNIDLIKKIAYDQRAYDLFKNAINEPDYNNYEAFYNKIIDEMVNNGINEAPIWKTVNKNYINENKLNFSHNRNDKLNVIMRLTSDKENLTKAQLYAIFKPENTLIIQCDVKNNQSFIEYGDLPSLTLISNHSWTILDGNELSLLDPDTLSQSLLALRQKYPLKVPMEIKLFNDNGKIENTAIYDPQHLAARLCQKLAEKGLNSSVSISQPKSEFMSPDYELGIFLDDYHEQQKNTFQFDITTQKLMINGEPPIKALLLDIVTGKITLAEITAKNPAILLPSFADQQGKLDIKKLKQTIYDPLLSIKVNQYFAHGDYLAHDARLRWNALFIAQKSLPLSQQSAELSFLVGELQANPYAVRYLSDHSRYLLGQYFSLNNGELDTIYLMQALAHPEYVEFIQTQLQEFSGLKISKEFDGLSLKQALMKSSTWRQRVLDNIVSLTKSAQCSQSEATISAVSHGYYLHKINTNSLRIEQALGALYVIACQQGKQAQFIKILAYHQALLELSSKSDLSIQDQQFLTEFDAALSQLQDINYAPRIENQSLKSWLMQASDGAYYLQSGKHAFTVVIKRQADIFQYQLYDPKAGELVISNSKQKQAQKDFFRVFQTYLDRETRYRKENTARKVDLMIENMNGDYRFDIYELTLTHQAVEKTHLFWQFTPP